MMWKVLYGVITADAASLEEEINALNKYQDKIIAVTQNGNCYTIFYENGGNERVGADNGC